MNVSCSQETLSLPGENNIKATVCNVNKNICSTEEEGTHLAPAVERRLCCENEVSVGS